MTEEETLLNELCESHVNIIESHDRLKDWIIDAMKEYAKSKLDEAIRLGYHLDGDSDEKVVDVMDLIEIKNKI